MAVGRDRQPNLNGGVSVSVVCSSSASVRTCLAGNYAFLLAARELRHFRGEASATTDARAGFVLYHEVEVR
jgi:hypothetical protein